MIVLLLVCTLVMVSCTQTPPVQEETLEETEITIIETEAATEAETEPVDPAADLMEADLYIVGGTTIGSVEYDHICYERVGYGDWLKLFFYDKMDIHNRAIHGLTSSSYHRQPDYQTLQEELKKGDYLLIAFGNGEFVKAGEDYSTATSFSNNLYKHYIQLAEEKGAIPILVTPVVAADPENDYTGEAVHNTQNGDYRQAILDLGAALNIPVIDLTAITKNRYEELGYEKAKTYHAVAEGQYYENTGVIMADYSTVNNVCLNARGAEYTAYLLAKELQKLEGIGDYVIADLKEPIESGILAPNCAYAPAHAPEVEKEVTIFIAGDSISADHVIAYYDIPSVSGGTYQATFGFGTQLYHYMTDNVTIRNYAIGGRSTKSFTTEYNYELIWQLIEPGDYLFIAFGHNDKRADDATRFTDATKDYTDPTSIGYYLYEYYIKPAREKGAIPILFTPMVYLDSTDSYTGHAVHEVDTGNYPQAIRDVGVEFDVPVVDLTAISEARYKELGYAEAVKYHPIEEAMLAEDGVTLVADMTTVDSTHLNLYGAKYMAYRIAGELRNIDGINQYISADLEEPTDIYYTVNPYYVLNQAQ